MRGSAEPAVDAWIDADLEDRLSGSYHGEPEEDGSQADPEDDEEWLRAKELALEDAWLVTDTLKAGQW